MDSAPDKTWMQEFASHFGASPSSAEREYQRAPSNETLKKFVLAGAPFMFNKPHLEKGCKNLKDLPYNHQAIQWTQEHFDPTYAAKWFPKNIPALIMAGSKDLPTPLKLFSQRDEFIRKNILMREIQNAGHFPWIEHPKAVVAAFADYLTLLKSKQKKD